MPEIEIRPATAADLPVLVNFDPNYISDYVWQMEISAEDQQIGVNFREIRLPRSVRVEYPRPISKLADEFTQYSGLLVALLAAEPVAFAGLRLGVAPLTGWVSDLVVTRRMRRQGIGSALVLAAEEWGLQHDCRNIVLEMQTKNYAAIHMAQKLGFDFCGYNDRYYANHDIGLFFGKSLR